MSLILEALKKLDREKQAPDRGLVVVGPAAWPSPHDRRFGGATGLALALVLLAGIAGAVWMLPRRSSPPAARPAVAAQPSPVPSPRVVVAAPVETGPAPAARPVTPAAPARAPAASGAPDPAPSPVADFQLQAISAQDGQPVAVLNDRLVREGDSFDGVRVVRIGAEEVEIEVKGRRRIVKF